MNSIRARLPRYVNDRVNLQMNSRAGGAPIKYASSALRTCIALRSASGVHGDGGDAEFTASADDSHGDLAAIGD